MTSKLFSLFTAATIVVATGCSSNEIGSSKDVAQEKIYQQYDATYAEGDKSYMVRAQFRFAGKNGTTLVLASPAYVQFDYQRIKVDSGKFAGAYYEMKQDAGMLHAKHSFVYYDINKKAFENSFFMNEFKLANVPAEVSKNEALVFNYSFEPAYSLTEDDYIMVSSTNTDSSFSYTITAKDTGNKITIPSADLKKQKGKEVEIEATLYRTVPMQQITPEGGQMNIRYALKPVKVKLKG